MRLSQKTIAAQDVRLSSTVNSTVTAVGESSKKSVFKSGTNATAAIVKTVILFFKKKSVGVTKLLSQYSATEEERSGSDS